MSIKVGVRVRPFNGREKERESVCIIEMVGNQTKIKDELGQDKTFTFDHSFWSHDGFEVLESGYFKAIDDKYADQTVVFDLVGKEILDNAWEGYHCCLFAYGQTGSGKSYSMVGYGSNKGVVPISCEEIFTRIKRNKEPDKSYEVQVSMLEIYNEKVQDLLVGASQRPASGLKVRESKVLGIFVEGLTKYPVTSYEEISKKMDEGYENRTIGSTQMNATSSRAHTIVTIEFKQLTTIGGKKSEKLSMINLVDLAGSERAGSTGATGDRLKEGCNINKSLLVLGNVINTLADKSMGKKKDLLPPYRDSALTRILQNALGGNSKTVMICALSPASINYEETLGTLRYADRAKKIQNKAVVNESEHDKMIRLLKEENMDLKKKIEDLQKKLGSTGGVIKEEDKEAFIELKEQYDANQKVMEDMKKTFQQRLDEAKEKEKEKESLGSKVDINFPHLVVLNEDPQLSHKLRYSLKTLPSYVGRKHGNPAPEITLSGIGIKQNHAVFALENEAIMLKPRDQGAKDYIFINGKKLVNDEGQILEHKDRIMFGTNFIVMFMTKSNGQDIYDVDWESAQIELQKEIEQNIKLQEKENEKKKKEEFDLIKKDLEEKYSKEKNEIEQKLKQQLESYEKQLQVMNENAEKKKLETQKASAERLLKQKLELLNVEKERHQREMELKEKSELIRSETMRNEREQLHKSEKLESSLMNVLKKITKMKIIMSELKRNIELTPVLFKDLVEHLKNPQSHTSILIRVENYEEGTVYYWSIETFHNRYDLMKELFNKYNDEDLDLFNIKNEEDPLWEAPRASLLGYAFYKLEPVGYLLNNFSSLPIISGRGIVVGQLDVEVIPHDENGLEFEEVPEQPSDLIGQPLMYKVVIRKLRDLSQNFCRKLRVEYQCFYDQTIIKTKIKENSEKKTNVDIEESFSHKIDYLTRQDIDFIEKDKINFKIYAYEEVPKKGKTASLELSPIPERPLRANGTFTNSFYQEPTIMGDKKDKEMMKDLPERTFSEAIAPKGKNKTNINDKKDCNIY